MGGHSTNDSTPEMSEISRLLSAAVINQNFCKLLLTNPEAAVSAGYLGEPFVLPQAEKARIASIRAATLADFASQLMTDFSM